MGGGMIGTLCSSLQDIAAGACSGVDEFCAFPNQSGFSVCLYALGDNQCPAGWTTRHRWFAQDQLCNCSCGDPVGEVCTATITVYEDGACKSQLGSKPVSSNGSETCLNVAPGSALGSKAATLDYMPGMCAPTLTMAQPSTLCCLP
jgi:hypothetical protein